MNIRLRTYGFLAENMWLHGSKTVVPHSHSPFQNRRKLKQVGLSQVSGDEQRRLCGDQKYSREMGQGLSLSLTLTTYGSVAYQLKDANLEATGTCDFVFRALRIVNKTGMICFCCLVAALCTLKEADFIDDFITVMVTILLACLSIMPLIMLIMGKSHHH